MTAAPRSPRRYPRETQLAVAAYAERNSDKLAAEHFGIPRTSVTSIRSRLAGTPEMAEVRAGLLAPVVEAYVGVAEEYVEVERLLLARARAAAADPRTTPATIAKMLSIVAPMARLTSGEATSRSQVSSLAMRLDSYRLPAQERSRAISTGDLPDKP